MDTPPPPPQAEWDFKECPVGQAKYCFHYEYGRNIGRVIEGIRQWRQSNPEGGSRVDFKVFCRSIIRNIVFDWTILYYCPEFPKTPFLEINEMERTKRIQQLREDDALEQAKWERNVAKARRIFRAQARGGKQRVKTHSQDRRGLYQVSIDQILDERRNLPCSQLSVEALHQTGRCKLDDGLSVVCLFQIMWWDQPKNRIVQDFREWLRRNSPIRKKGPKRKSANRKTRPFDRRGRRVAEAYLSALKQLGAWRLLNKYGYSETDAINLTSKSQKVTQAVLYATKSFARAAAKAGKWLEKVQRVHFC